MINSTIIASPFQDKFTLSNQNNNFQVTHYIFYHNNGGPKSGKFLLILNK